MAQIGYIMLLSCWCQVFDRLIVLTEEYITDMTLFVQLVLLKSFSCSIHFLFPHRNFLELQVPPYFSGYHISIARVLAKWCHRQLNDSRQLNFKLMKQNTCWQYGSRLQNKTRATHYFYKICF